MTTPEKIARGLKAFEDAKAAHERKDFAAAAKLFKLALALMPNHPHVLLAYGKLAEEVPDWSAAEKIYRKLGELRPESNFEGALATALFKLERFDEALPLLERHGQRVPGEKGVFAPLAICYAHANRWEDSLAAARTAIRELPDEVAWDCEINALYQLGRYIEIEDRLAKGMELYPESKGIRSLYCLHNLKKGNYAGGFRYMNDLRWRNNQKNWERMEALGKVTDVVWDGERFDGVLIIHAEQGVGDELLLSSMFDDLLATGQPLLIECDKRLIPLYERSYPGLPLLPRTAGKKDYKPDDGREHVVITALDASRTFRRDRARFPDERHAWLKADPERVEHLRREYRQRWPGKRLIGVSWKSKRLLEGGNKNIELDALRQLLARDDCAFISLQYGDIDDEIAFLAAHGIPVYVDPNIDSKDDLDGLAAQISALDLVVSISTTVVHLAGALGVPCWVMLPKTKPVLWYWGYQGERTPWYPSLRFFRCETDGNWQNVIDDIGRELDRLPEPRG